MEDATISGDGDACRGRKIPAQIPPQKEIGIRSFPTKFRSGFHEVPMPTEILGALRLPPWEYYLPPMQEFSFLTPKIPKFQKGGSLKGLGEKVTQY